MNIKPTTKYNSIELIRFIASVSIALYHFGSFYLNREKIFPLSYIFVEFFFIVSGFFMMKHICEKEAPLNTYEYVFKKIRNFFPVYCVTFIVQFIIFSITNNLNTVEKIVGQLFHFKWEFLLLHGAGFIQDPTFGIDYLQGQTWYLSAMVIALLLTYPLAKYYKKLFIYIICPLSCIIIYSYIIQTQGDLNVGNEYFGIILAAIPRGFAGTCAGCIAYNIYNKLNNRSLNKKLAFAIELLSYISIISLFVFGRKLAGEDSLFYVIIFAAIVVLGCLNQTGISRFFNTKTSTVLAFLGRHSLYLYMCHWNILMGMRLIAPNIKTLTAFVIYIILNIIYSFILKWIDSVIKQKIYHYK